MTKKSETTNKSSFHRVIWIPVALNLSKRGVRISSRLCPLCRDGEEDVIHLFFTCPFSVDLWNRICFWLKFLPRSPSGVEDLLMLIKGSAVNRKFTKLRCAIVYSTLWFIWKYRNNTVFKSSLPGSGKAADDIQCQAFSWCKNRAKFSSLNWHDWCNSPLNCIL